MEGNKMIKKMGIPPKKSKAKKVLSKQDQRDWNAYIQERFPGPTITEGLGSFTMEARKSLSKDFRKWQNSGNRGF